jgi:geranylgeranyl diphosphate synthase type II
VRSPDELRGLLEVELADLTLAAELGDLGEVMRYTLDTGGKRIRPVLCLATAEAVGGEREGQRALPAAIAVELVHTFSLVHDDLPALDDDDERRGRPSAHVRFGEAAAILAGDALLTEAFRLALSYATPAVARELALATAGMIGGQYLDVANGSEDLLAVNRLKTGRLFEAAVACGLWSAAVPENDHEPWRSFAADVGTLFQLVDDILDRDGYAARHGHDEARRRADETAGRARTRLVALAADTGALEEIVDDVAARV